MAPQPYLMYTQSMARPVFKPNSQLIKLYCLSHLQHPQYCICHPLNRSHLHLHSHFLPYPFNPENPRSLPVVAWWPNHHFLALIIAQRHNNHWEKLWFKNVVFDENFVLLGSNSLPWGIQDFIARRILRRYVSYTCVTTFTFFISMWTLFSPSNQLTLCHYLPPTANTTYFSCSSNRQPLSFKCSLCLPPSNSDMWEGWYP